VVSRCVMEPVDNPIKDHGARQMADRDVDDVGSCHTMIFSSSFFSLVFLRRYKFREWCSLSLVIFRAKHYITLNLK